MLASPYEVRRLCAAGVLAIAISAVGGCGGDDEKTEKPGGGAPTPAPTGGGQTLNLKADASGQLRFDKKTLQASAGKVTIVMSNPASVPHDVSIEGQGVEEKALWSRRAGHPGSPRRSSPASTRSTARCLGIGRAAWSAR